MGFKLKSGNKVPPFKMMGSSPMKEHDGTNDPETHPRKPSTSHTSNLLYNIGEGYEENKKEKSYRDMEAGLVRGAKKDKSRVKIGVDEGQSVEDYAAEKGYDLWETQEDATKRGESSQYGGQSEGDYLTNKSLSDTEDAEFDEFLAAKKAWQASPREGRGPSPENPGTKRRRLEKEQKAADLQAERDARRNGG